MNSNTTFTPVCWPPQPLHSAPRAITRTFDLLMLSSVLRLIGCGCSQGGTLRTAGHLDLWGSCSGFHGWLVDLNWTRLWRSPRHCCCCFWRWSKALCQPGTRTQLVGPDGGCGERPASPAAGRTEAPCSCTSCYKGAPCLCYCRQHEGNRGVDSSVCVTICQYFCSSLNFYFNRIWITTFSNQFFIYTKCGNLLYFLTNINWTCVGDYFLWRNNIHVEKCWPLWWCSSLMCITDCNLYPVIKWIILQISVNWQKHKRPLYL